MNNSKNIVSIVILAFLFFSCQKENITNTNFSELLWLENKGAQMPILVEGNLESKTFLLMLHGGPGGSAKIYNEMNIGFSDPIEDKYAVAYWDQRLAGNSRGNFDLSDFSKDLMIEDLDLVVDLLRHRYGQDISIFFFGHSWGGYLGNAYLIDYERQQKINGWIDVAGAHNIEKLILDGLDLMKITAEEQIAINSSAKNSWEKILNFVNKTDTTNVNTEMTLEVNEKAGEAIKYATNDNLISGRVPSSHEFFNTFFGDYSWSSQIANASQTGRSNIWEEILNEPLSDKLQNIELPTLLLWGKYDFVVPPTLGEEMYNNIGTSVSDKSLHIFDDCGHSPPDSKMEETVRLILEFMEKYK